MISHRFIAKILKIWILMVVFLFYTREVKQELQSKPKNEVLENIYNL